MMPARTAAGPTPISFTWRLLPDDGRWFVYSPRFGATYRLDRVQIENGLLFRLLGLPEAARADDIVDPVTRTGLAGSHEKSIPPDDLAAWADAEPPDVVRRLSRWYSRFHRQRWRFRPRNMARWAGRIAASLPADSLSLDRIGRLVALSEARAGVSDCYPRSLLLGALCGRAGVPYEITVGILAPTRKLHAWCTSGGTLLYEPTPRHWWYQPLANFGFAPPHAASVERRDP